MKTVLFAWELGANLGHAIPLARVAASLGGDIRCVFAVRNLEGARSALGPDSARVLQAPVWPRHRSWSATGTLAGYADILAGIGFGEPAQLDVVVRAWRELLDLIRPDLIVADHSPALMLSLFGENTPVVAVGTSFTMPPLGLDRFPPLQADRATAMPEGRLLESARVVQKARGAGLPSSLIDIFRSPARFVFGLPELDPYRAFRNEPIHVPPEGLPTFSEPVERRLFAYLGGELPQLELLAQVLSELDTPVECHLRGEVGSVGAFLRMRGHVVHDQPPDLSEALPRCSHVLSQGGAFTSAAALAAGRPQLIVPLHNEALLNVRLLRQYGVAQTFTPNGSRSAMQANLLQFLADPGLRENARECARRLALRPLPDGRQACAEAITRLLG